ncbi:MAG TPA: DUF5054 domain-containing protein, partial [Prolixibacteraceae bacterium]
TPTIAGFSKNNIPDNKAINKVHLIFKTHLDVGFTNLAGKVVKTYMEEFIPGALSLSENLRQKNQTDRFVWTTGSWLIYEFLEKADPSMRKRMEKAIEYGDIVWHGLPFTLHSELADPSLYDLGIQLSVGLDKRFGTKTISAKMTDVPGHTRGIVPILAKNHIEFLHIGVNPASMPPDVPPLFVWRAPDGSEVVVMYQKDYGSQMIIPGTQTAVAICFTSDNHGPQKPEQIAQIYSDLRKQFPNAEIQASTFNAITVEVSAVRNQLPVITQELGDTWIHGAGSDPLKISQFREISRLRNKWLNDKKLKFGDATDLAFGIQLLMVAEHTWGLDVKTFLKDWDIYKPQDFEAARSKPNFKLMEQSWNEKREYINTAISQLPTDNIKEAKQKLEDMKPVHINKSGFTKINNVGNEIDTPFFELKIDKLTGGIIKFKDKATGFDWASGENPLCLFSYQTFSKPDYDRFQNQYLTQKIEWAIDDFGKTGQEVGNAISRTWTSSLKEAFIKKDNNGQNILLDLTITDEKGNPVGGSPRNIIVELFLPDKTKEMWVTLQWFNKPAYRLPEASWFSFIPTVQNGEWIIDKMGQPVNSRDVIKNGNRKLHAALEGVRFESKTNNCSITSLDAPLVAQGERNLLNFDNRLPEANEGVHFCLHNNVWGTNFVMWFEDDMKYRFVLKV